MLLISKVIQDYNSIENGEQISIVLHLSGLRFLKKQFYCNVEIKQIVKVNNYQLVDYDSGMNWMKRKCLLMTTN